MLTQHGEAQRLAPMGGENFENMSQKASFSGFHWLEEYMQILGKNESLYVRFSGSENSNAHHPAIAAAIASPGPEIDSDDYKIARDNRAPRVAGCAGGINQEKILLAATENRRSAKSTRRAGL